MMKRFTTISLMALMRVKCVFSDQFLILSIGGANMKRRIFCLSLVCMMVFLSVPTMASAASCKAPAYNYMTLNFTGERHNVKSYFSGIKIHSGDSVMNNEVKNTTYAYSLLRLTNDSGKWDSSSSTKEDTSTSSTVTAYTTPLTRYVTKGKAVCNVHCHTCNSNLNTGTGEKSTSGRTSGSQFKITL